MSQLNTVWILYGDIPQCERVGKQHVVPLDSSRGPQFSKKFRDNERATLPHSRLLQTGFCAPLLREVVILGNTTFDSAVIVYCTKVIWTHLTCCSFVNCRVNHLMIGDCFICSSWTCIKETPVMCFLAVKAILCHYNAVQIAAYRAFVPACCYDCFCGLVMLW